jgi:hypothetical protein
MERELKAMMYEPDDGPAETPSPTHPASNNNELDKLYADFYHRADKTADHERLSKLTGSWDIHCDFDVFGYGPNFSATGISNGKAFYSSRFIDLHWDLNSKFATWKARWTIGYDTVIEKYHLVMLESLHNGMLIAEGTWDPHSHAIRFWGEASNPMFGSRHDCALRITFERSSLIRFSLAVPDKNGKFGESMDCALRRQTLLDS